jgi:CheY-like chemotaxis protein/HPt (histidine-containing phosphotransfer) domain-containing protein
MLEYEGANVVLTENGQQAIDRLKEISHTAFDIVLMDMQMPVMDGYEATRRINSIAPSLPVIGLTAHAMTDEKERCLAAGMVAHVTKPVDQDYLVTVLLQHLSATEIHEDHTPTETSTIQHFMEAGEVRHYSLPGFDVDSALENLKCDLSSFKKILLTFYRQRMNNYEELSASLARGDVEQARNLVHGIKGSSGYLGARKLHHAAIAMEKAFDTGDMDIMEEKLSAFRQTFVEAMDGLSKLEQEAS